MSTMNTSVMEHDKIERLRDRMLQCPICMDEYKDPRILTCHHTVCLSCLLDYIHASSSSGRMFRCPQCRADVCVPRGGVKDFPPNFYINCIQDEIGSRPYFGICDVCERDWLMSQYRCIDCDLDICKFCIHEHRLFKHMTGRQPNIIKIETGNIGINLTSEKSCTDHKDESLQMYCMTCDVAICVSCVCEKHRKHNTMTLVKKLQVARKLLQFDYDQLMLDVKEVKNSLTKLHDVEKKGDKSADDAISQIKDYTQGIISCIEKMSDEKIDQIKADRGKHLKEIHDYEKDLAVFLEQLHRGSTFLGDLQDEDMCLELLTAFQKYKGVIESTQKSVANRKIKQNNFSFCPGKVNNKLGNIWISRSVLGNNEEEKVFLPREQTKKGMSRLVSGRISLTGCMLVLVFLFLLIGLVQFVMCIADNGANVENIMCTALYGYLCLAGVFSYRKSR
ncbi:tripartite motif-containing protein 45-like [Mercenaria mercenaria]|uniref:tripartite motif-containing protein 45-like n=1 Tax=Mercenaria mercenaria TaxID=6596 RepID=UPI00234ECD5C|nr:tripartite motif-containing protein 45-like [Mercenaria mercenaria]